jgi:hypothetical protein
VNIHDEIQAYIKDHGDPYGVIAEVVTLITNGDDLLAEVNVLLAASTDMPKAERVDKLKAPGRASRKAYHPCVLGVVSPVCTGDWGPDAGKRRSRTHRCARLR